MAPIISPTTHEAAARATSDGFDFNSIWIKDDFNDECLLPHLKKIKQAQPRAR